MLQRYLAVLFSKGVGALGHLILFLFIGNAIGIAALGEFSYYFTIILSLSIVSKLGVDVYISKYAGVSVEDDIFRYKLLMNVVFKFSVFITLFFTVILIFSLGDRYVFPYILTVNIIILSLISLISGYYKGVGKPVKAVFFEYSYISLLSAITLFVLLLFNGTISLVDVSCVWTLFSFLFLVKSPAIKVLRSNIKHQLPFKKEEISSFYFYSLAILMQTLGLNILSKITLNEVDLGYFRLILQCSMLISFMMFITNAMMPSIITKLNVEGADWVNYRIKRVSKINLALALLVGVVIIFTSSEMLELFSSDPVPSYVNYSFIILCLSGFFNVITGPLIPILQFTGKEKVALNFISIFNIVLLLLFFILSKGYGVLGGSLSISIIVVIQNLSLLIYVYKRTKIRIY